MEDKDLVKYNNVLNKLNMGKLEEKELELFFALCLELKNKETDEVFINITDFKNKYNMGRSNQRFEKYMEIVLEKFLETKMVIKTAKTLELGNFFRKFKLEFETNTLYVQLDNDYKFILNNLVEMYTQFSFKQYQELKSKYAKRLMPKLSQWNGTKKIEYKKNDLYEILGASESYKNDISSFNKRILKPATSELKKIFYNLKVKPIKNTNKSINSYLFTWNDKPKNIEDVEVIEEVKTLEISKKLKIILDEAVKNPKLEILEKPSVIEYLIKHYTENIIVLGIKQLLTSNITTKIKTRKYITSVLDKIKETENIKIITKEDKKIIENKKEIEEYKPKELIEINQEEWNKIYKEKLDEALEEFKKQGTTVNTAFIEQTIKIRMKATYKIKE
ncbi:replication initiation protein [Fusobacterium polymorphum]|jgi:replication protein (fragment)|uniref:replication initiation protein n=1 Tax=Fusobacterium nucleatum subsp. polymorphum TaxID=76857 RepID=UPI0030089C7F